MDVIEPKGSKFYSNTPRTYFFEKPEPEQKEAENWVGHFHLDINQYGQPYNPDREE